MLVALLLVGAQADPFQPRVSNGKPAIRGQFPFIAHIEIFAPKGPDVCTGSLISPDTVLTAAHCCACDGSNSYKVTINAFNADPEGPAIQDGCTESYSTSTAECHPLYSPELNYENDYCILHLPEPSAYTPITLYDSSKTKMNPRADSGGKTVVISGFGATSGAGSLESTLQKAQVKILDVDQCLERWQEQATLNRSKVVCGDVSKKQDACGGDSGAAMFTKLNGKFLQLGVVSYGAEECEANNFLPGVYGKVDDDVFKSWIFPFITAQPTSFPTFRPTTARPTKGPRVPTSKKPPSDRPTRQPTAPTHLKSCNSNAYP